MFAIIRASYLSGLVYQQKVKDRIMEETILIVRPDEEVDEEDIEPSKGRFNNRKWDREELCDNLI